MRGQDELYREAAATHAVALERLARAYEADADKRRDLVQEIHIALWRSFAGFNGTCSMRTWVYRVAHNTATSHVVRERRRSHSMVSLEEIENMAGQENRERAVQRQETLERLQALIRRLKPLDRQVVLSYLEGMEASSIAEITGLSAGNVATKIHRIKNILSRNFHEGGRDDE
jgi:RNA polymerase sigma-70 factor (ECF subfamily)